MCCYSRAGRWHLCLRHIERLGADAIVYPDVPQLGELVARTSGDTELGPGAEVFASPQDGAEHRFPGWGDASRIPGRLPDTTTRVTRR